MLCDYGGLVRPDLMRCSNTIGISRGRWERLAGCFEIRLESSGRLDGDRDARQRKHCDVVVLAEVHRGLRRLLRCWVRRKQQLQSIEAVELAALEDAACCSVHSRRRSRMLLRLLE